MHTSNLRWGTVLWKRPSLRLSCCCSRRGHQIMLHGQDFDYYQAALLDWIINSISLGFEVLMRNYRFIPTIWAHKVCKYFVYCLVWGGHTITTFLIIKVRTIIHFAFFFKCLLERAKTTWYNCFLFVCLFLWLSTYFYF